MKTFFIIISLILISIVTSFSKNNTNSTILIAQIGYTPNIDEVTDYKVEAAFAMISNLVPKYQFISLSLRDSISDVLTKEGNEPTVKEVAKKLEAGSIYFLKISRLAAMLRVEIAKTTLKNTNKSTKGVGYSLLHYINDNSDKFLYDPTLLEAIQRAVADVEHDSLMFSKAEGQLRVYPAPTMVIGGIDFRNNDEFKSWDIYDHAVVNSYMATELIFDVARKNPHYVVYDMPSRDSLYSLFNMRIVENYRPPTSYEVDALSRLEVEYYLTGNLKRTEDGAKLELFLCKIHKKQLLMLKEEDYMLKEDSIEEMKKAFTQTAEKLFNVESEK